MCRPVVSHAAQRYPPSRRFRIHAEYAADKPAGYPPSRRFRILCGEEEGGYAQLSAE